MYLRASRIHPFAYSVALGIVVCIVALAVSCRQSVRLSGGGSSLARFNATLDSAKTVSERSPDAALKTLIPLDSIYQGASMPDSQWVRLYKLEAELYRKSPLPDSGFAMLLKARDLLLRSGDSLAFAGILIDMAEWKEREGRYRTALDYAVRAEGVYRRAGRVEEHANALLVCARQGLKLASFTEASNHVLEALKLYEGLGKPEKQGEAYNVLGTMVSAMGDKAGALDYYRQALQVLIPARDSGRLATVLMNIGLLHRVKRLDSVPIYYDSASLYAKGPRYTMQQVMIMFNRANLYFDRSQLDSAKRMYDSVMMLCRRHGFKDGIPRVFSGYAAIALKRNEIAASVAYLAEGRRMADSMGQPQLALALRRQELDAAVKRREPDSIFAISNEIKKREDSLSGLEKKRLVAELELGYQVERKDRQLMELRRGLLNRQRLIGLLLVLLLVSGIAAFMYRRQRILLQERNASYASLIRRYQSERDRPGLANPGGIPVSGIIEEDISRQGGVSSSEGVSNGEAVADRIVVDAELLSLHTKIVQLMGEETLYRDPELTPSTLAKRLGMPARRLSEVVAAVEGCSVSQYFNRLRVAEASRILESEDAQVYKLETLAEQCGFNSRQHFHRVFEQVTGVSPGFYRKRFHSDTAEEI
jgi:AraC-like DNA-binding protein